MARLEALKGLTVALDSVLFIYALEGNRDFGEGALAILSAIERGSIRAVASELVLAELIVKPLKLGRQEVAERYLEELPKFPNLSFLPLSRAAIVAAAQLRVASGLLLVDALHLATAREANAGVFITNDSRLKRAGLGLEVWLLSEMEA